MINLLITTIICLHKQQWKLKMSISLTLGIVGKNLSKVQWVLETFPLCQAKTVVCGLVSSFPLGSGGSLSQGGAAHMVAAAAALLRRTVATAAAAAAAAWHTRGEAGFFLSSFFVSNRVNERLKTNGFHIPAPCFRFILPAGSLLLMLKAI